MTYVKICKQCGKKFEAKRSHAECCSSVCRARFSQGLASKAPVSASKSESAKNAQAFSQAASMDIETILNAIAQLRQDVMSLIANPQPMTFAFQGVGVMQPQPPMSPPKPLELDLGDVIEVRQSVADTLDIAQNFLASFDSVDF